MAAGLSPPGRRGGPAVPEATTLPRRRVAGCAVAFTALALAGCKGTGPRTVPVRSPSLYDRLGGMPAIEAVAGRFVANLRADPRLGGRFAETDTAALQAKLASQICLIAGGPCVYTGRDMRSAHAGMRISEAEFAAAMQDLAAALDSQGVGERERDELLGLLEPHRATIVGG